MAIDRTKFDFSTAVALHLKPSCATVVLHGSSSTCIGFKRRPTAVQFINYKYIRIHLKDCLTVSLILVLFLAT